MEQTERRLTLGKEFYDSLIDDLADHSAAVEYDPSATYSTGDEVIFSGILYASLVDSNDSEPGTKGKWDFAPKFTKTENNELWCFFLGRYLALHVIDQTMPSQTTQLRGAGAIQVNGDDFKAAEKEDRDSLHSGIKALIFSTFENMHDYLVSNKGVFGSYKGQKSTESCEDSESNCITAEDIYSPETGLKEASPIVEYDTSRNQYNGNIYRLG